MSLEHPDLDTLARLAEGTLAGEEAEATRDHLARCRSCMAAYVDAVRYRAAWLNRPEDFVSGEHVRAQAAAAVAVPVRTRRAARVARASARWLVAGAGVAAVVALLVLVRPPAPLGRGLDLPPAVRHATGLASARGLVLPGGEASASARPPDMRSGASTMSPQLEAEVRRLVDRYEGGDRGHEAAAALVASLLAAGELDAARDYAREALRRFPRDARLLVFAAEVEFRKDDLAASAALLERARQLRPEDPVVALDLGLVLRQQGRAQEARALLERASRGRQPAVADRALAELAADR